jgi:protein arginine N-methyltransferase 3
MERSLAGKDEAEERLRSDEEEEEEEEEGEEGWDDWCSDGDDAGGWLLCLFCSTRFDADSSLLEHCAAEHRFDFHRIVKELGLDFYGCIKLINFVRSKVCQQHPVLRAIDSGNLNACSSIFS